MGRSNVYLVSQVSQYLLVHTRQILDFLRRLAQRRNTDVVLRQCKDLIYGAHRVRQRFKWGFAATDLIGAQTVSLPMTLFRSVEDYNCLAEKILRPIHDRPLRRYWLDILPGIKAGDS